MPPDNERFTFAIVGHDEVDTVAAVVAEARSAAWQGDEVWFVDSASTDGSADAAAQADARVVEAPLGKGRAVARAFELCDEGWICLLDADTHWSERSIPAELRRVASEADADMVVGEIDMTGIRRSAWPGIYRPLGRSLFPEALGRFPGQPLSGFRALNAELDLGELPPGYGIETHLNLMLAADHRPTARTPLGGYRGPLRDYANVPTIARDVAETILDLAEARCRLRPERRPAWENWIEPVLEVISAQPPPGADTADYDEKIAGLAARPLPPAL